MTRSIEMKRKETICPKMINSSAAVERRSLAPENLEDEQVSWVHKHVLNWRA